MPRIKTIRTDHSLFDLEYLGGVAITLINTYMDHIDCSNHVIAVSNAVRENYLVRTGRSPSKTSVIPNAIDCSKFPADPSKISPLGTINIVFMARITWRKGIDFLIGLIPRICKKYPNVYWIIGGNGDMDPELKFLIQKFKLEDRVELLGYVNHKDVGSVLNRGHIFLNASVTEAFCIAALEAASAGLLVVTTDVGGTPEILPEDLLYLAKPTIPSLNKMLEKAIADVHKISPSENHERIRKFYDWRDVSARVEKIYYEVLEEPYMTFKQRFNNATETCK